MKPALIITHLEDRDAGLVSEALAAASCPMITRHPDDAQPLPAVDEISGIVSMGGNQSATRAGRDPFLRSEVGLMADALAGGVPVLGMCLGAQLLAVAGGGGVSTMERMYAGWPELTPLPARREDPLWRALPPRLRVLKWHEDVIDPPRRATALCATPGPGASLFRIGPAAWGSQVHFEATPAMLFDAWLAEDDGVAQIEAAGHDIDAFRARSAELLPVQMSAARPVFAAFAQLVVGRA
ncbi:MAG: type 1 glutamine amidotransferase [Solirubrobacteraceae bacterium]|jgi:GMP synthase-like glutamine amidotransferase